MEQETECRTCGGPVCPVPCGSRLLGWDHGLPLAEVRYHCFLCAADYFLKRYTPYLTPLEAWAVRLRQPLDPPAVPESGLRSTA